MAMGTTGGLELDLKEMIALIGRQQHLLSSLGEKGAQLDETKESLGKEVVDLRSTLNSVSSELIKANETIQKLQDENLQQHRRLKTQENILTSQEAQMKAKEERLSQTGTAFNGLSERVSKLETELDDTNILKVELEERLKIAEESLTTKENMINYLSKQVIDSEGFSKQTTEAMDCLKEANKKLEIEVKHFKEENEDLANRLKIAEEGLTSKETMVGHLTKQLQDSENLSKLMTQEIQVLRKNNQKLDVDYHDKKKAVGNLMAKMTTLEADLQDKTALVSRQQDFITSLGEKGAQIEQRKDSLSREVDDLKFNLRELSSELGKANDIIRKLQEDGRQVTRRLKAQENILISQDNQLRAKTDALTQSTTALKSATEKLSVLEKEVAELKPLKESLEARVKVAEDSLLTKENMITYLSKQLNEYEGLSNLDKFRHTLSQVNTLNETTDPGKNVTTPSWMHSYNSSTLGASNQRSPPIPLQVQQSINNSNGGGDQGKKNTLPSTSVAGGGRVPSWAKTNKATLENLLQKSRTKK